MRCGGEPTSANGLCLSLLRQPVDLVSSETMIALRFISQLSPSPGCSTVMFLHASNILIDRNRTFNVRLIMSTSMATHQIIAGNGRFGEGLRGACRHHCHLLFVLYSWVCKSRRKDKGVRNLCFFLASSCVHLGPRIPARTRSSSP